MSFVKVSRGLCLAVGAAGLVSGVLLGVELQRMARLGEAFIVSDVASLPPREFAVVLGCAPLLADGRKNLYFEHRMDAAAQLFHQGRTARLWLSGNGHSPRGNEPAAMREALVARGVPSDKLLVDPDGTRTLDSLLRVAQGFPGQEFWLVSQRFHLERALYLTHALGLPALGYPAQDVPPSVALAIRERLARVRAVVDVLWR